MTKKMKRLLASADHTGALLQCWPILEEVLNEQQRIMVSVDDPCPHQLKGFVKAYRVLEEFKDEGEKRKSSEQES